MENFVNNMNDLLDKHAPFKKISKYKLKFKTKPWITTALQKSISVKNSLFKKYIRLKIPVKKNEIYTPTIQILQKSPFNVNEKKEAKLL